MALSVNALAVHLHLTADPAADLPAAQRLVLEGLHNAARTIVDEIAPDAPDALADQAVIALASYLHDRPYAGSGERYAHAFRNSGAEAMLARYIPKRILVVA